MYSLLFLIVWPMNSGTPCIYIYMKEVENSAVCFSFSNRIWIRKHPVYIYVYMKKVENSAVIFHFRPHIDITKLLLYVYFTFSYSLAYELWNNLHIFTFIQNMLRIPLIRITIYHEILRSHPSCIMTNIRGLSGSYYADLNPKILFKVKRYSSLYLYGLIHIFM